MLLSQSCHPQRPSLWSSFLLLQRYGTGGLQAAAQSWTCTPRTAWTHIWSVYGWNLLNQKRVTLFFKSNLILHRSSNRPCSSSGSSSAMAVSAYMLTIRWPARRAVSLTYSFSSARAWWWTEREREREILSCSEVWSAKWYTAKGLRYLSQWQGTFLI